jgi:hypothetical protein
MQHRYALPERIAIQATSFEEFANGAAQCHAVLFDGATHSGVLISNATAIIAMRGHKGIPFPIASIVSLYQDDEDRRPSIRGDWEFFDRW